jgi:gliding motility-associated-like protein
MNSRLLRKWGVPSISLCLFFLIPQLIGAQTCPNLAGATSFAPKSGHESDYFYTLDNVELEGPLGNFLGTDAKMAEFGYDFDDDNPIHEPTNPDYAPVSTDFIYCVVDTTTKLNPLFEERIGNNFVFMRPDKLQEILSYTITSLKPGTTIKISGTFEVLTPNLDDGNHKVSYDGGVTYSYMDWNQSGTFSVNVNGKPAGDIKATYSNPKVDFEFEYELGPNDKLAKVSVMTGHNVPKAVDAFALYSLKVEGCLNPIITSSQPSPICEGEQTLFSLDKEYNASSYLWEWNDGSGWTTISTKKSALVEVNKAGSVRCTMDGLVAEALDVTTMTCCQVNGKPASRKTVFHETFGYFKDERTYVDKDGNESTLPVNYPDFRTTTSFNLPMHDFDDGSGTPGPITGEVRDGQINDCKYGVVVPTPKGYILPDGFNYAEWMAGVVADHTSAIDGHSNGAALFINVNNQYQQSTGTAGYAGPIFESQIDGLCANKELYFETFFANMTGGPDPFVSLYIRDAQDPSIVLGKNENIVIGAGVGEWIRVAIEDLIIPSTSVILQVVADCGSRCNDGQYWRTGNDLIIDDIKFMTCSPPSVNIYSDLSNFTQDTTICSDVVIRMQAPTSQLLVDYFGGNQKFLYQVSVDKGVTWSNYDYSTEAFTDVSTDQFPNESDIRVRVIVGSQAALDKFYADPSAVLAGDDCSDYSISDEFKISRAGDLDMGKDVTTSACKGETVLLEGSQNSEIVSWSWEKADGTVLVPLSQVEADRDYSFQLLDKSSLVFIGYSPDGCVGKRKYEVDVNPTAEVQLLLDMYCDSTILSYSATPANATLDWVLDGVAYTPSSPIVFKQADMGAKLSVVASAAGYCESLPAEEVIAVKQSPVAPTTLDIDLVATPNKSISLDTAATADAGCSLLWYGNGSVYTSTAATAIPSLSIAQEGTFYYWVTQVNADNCESDTVRVTVTVNDAPLPTTRDTMVCVGESVNLSDLATPENNTDYTLNWYIDNNVQKETSVPTVDVSIPTMRTFYVSQTNNAAAIPVESKKKKIVVEIFAVQKPTKPADIQLCYGDNAPVLSYTNEAALSHYLGADATVWYVNGVAQSVVPVISTAVQQTTTTTYSIGQTYTIPTSSSVCVGDTTSFNVTVTVVQAPTGSFNVGYVRSEAANNNGVFADDLLKKDSAVAVPNQGCQLLWYDENKNIIGNGLTAPTPKYDANWQVGQEVKFTYYVAQKDVATGCVSEMKEVEVVISDSPKPKVTPLYYCVGDDPKSTSFAKDLLASATPDMTINPQGNYKLLWFSSADEYKTNPAAGVETPVKVPSTQSAGTQEFFVCQYDNDSKAMSFPSSVLVTVYENPLLTPQSTTQVCDLDGAGATVDLNEGYKTDIVTTAEFFLDAAAQTPINPIVSSSATYYARGYYSPIANLVCYSTIEPIVATIYDLNTPTIDAKPTACPGSVATLSATAVSLNPGATSVSYAWSASDGSSYTGSTITSNPLPAEAKKTVTYSVVATVGSCQLSASHTITVGSAPISGEISIVEAQNATPFSIVNQSATEIYTCGGDLEMTATMTKTEGDYVWYKNNVQVATGDIFTTPMPEGDASFRVEFINECPTYMDFIVHSIPVTATPIGSTTIEICEGEKFTTGLTFTSRETPEIQWYKGTELISGANQKDFVINSVSDSDDGVYNFVVKNSACTAKGDAHTLNAKPYIKVTEFTSPFIVPRNGSQTIDLDITVPTSGGVQNIDWIENGATVSSDKSYSINNVVADHNYHITLSDPEYCEASLDVIVWVDAELQLTTQLKDTLCIGSADILVIDTTGTGAFRQPGVIPSLKVSSSIGGETKDLSSSLQKVGDKLQLTVSPDLNATYKVDFIYGTQNLSSSELVTVIPAITVVVPKAQEICEGESATIYVEKVLPIGTTVSWLADPTIEGSTDGDSITVKPIYAGGANSQSIVYYTAVAYNKLCDSEAQFEVPIKVDEPLSGFIAGKQAICENESAVLNATDYSASVYSWSANGSVLSNSGMLTVKPAETTTYIVDMERGMCKASDNFTVEVTSIPTIVSVDSVGIRDRQVIVEAGKGTPPFEYWCDENKNLANVDDILYGLSFTSHVAHVMDINGCTSSMQFVMLPPQISIPEHFSPNGDGVNDNWVVGSLADVYPEALVVIYDRFGKELIRFRGEDANGWDGTYNGVSMPSTDYWYVIDIEEIDMQYTGHFTLVRQ